MLAKWKKGSWLFQSPCKQECSTSTKVEPSNTIEGRLGGFILEVYWSVNGDSGGKWNGKVQAHSAMLFCIGAPGNEEIWVPYKTNYFFQQIFQVVDYYSILVTVRVLTISIIIVITISQIASNLNTDK